MGATKRQTLEAPAQLKALHAALYFELEAAGRLGQVIPVREWEAIIIQCLGTLTRQSCQDKTWCLERMGLIERRERVGVIVLAPVKVSL